METRQDAIEKIAQKLTNSESHCTQPCKLRHGDCHGCTFYPSEPAAEIYSMVLSSLASSTGEELELAIIDGDKQEECFIGGKIGYNPIGIATSQMKDDNKVLTKAKAIIAAQKVEIDRLKGMMLTEDELKCFERDMETSSGWELSALYLRGNAKLKAQAALSNQQEEK